MSDIDYRVPEEFLANLKRLRDQEIQGSLPEVQQADQEELGGLDFYQVAANAHEGRDTSLMGPVQQLLVAGDFDALRARLGETRGNAIRDAYLTAWQKAAVERQATRSVPEAITDAAVGIPASLLNSAWSAEMLAAGLASPDAMAESAQANKEFNQEYIDPLYSQGLQSHRRLAGALDAGAAQEHAQQAAREIAAGGDEFWAGTKRLGKDIGSSAWSTLTDPMLLAQGTAEAAASMVEAGFIQKGLMKLGTIAVEHAAAKVIAEDVAAGAARSMAQALETEGVKALEKRLTNVAVMGATGLTEGVGAYQQSAESVLSKSPEELLQTSVPYREKVLELMNAGVPREKALLQAKNWLTHKAAFAASVGTGIASAAIGHFLPEGVEDPFHVKSTAKTTLGAWGKDVGKETLEEFLQGGSGQFISNKAAQEYVNPNQDLLEGVGQQAGQGGVLGGFSAGAFKGQDLIHGTGSLGADGVKYLAEKGANRKLAKLEAEAVQSAANLTAEAEGLYNDKAKMKELLKLAGEAFTDNLEGHAAATPVMDALIRSPVVNEIPKSIEALPEEVQGKFAKNMNRVAAITRAATLLNESKDPEEKAKLGEFLNDLLEPVRRFQQTPKELEALNGNARAKELVQGYQQLMQNVGVLPQVQKAQTELAELLQKKQASGEKISDAQLAFLATRDPNLGGTVTSAQVEEVLKRNEQSQATPVEESVAAPIEQISVALVTAAAPVKSKTSTQSLAHGSGSGGGILTETLRKALVGSLAAIRSREAAEKLRTGDNDEIVKKFMNDHILGERTSESVGRQVTHETDEKYLQNGKFSVKQHIDRISKALMSGNIGLAKRYHERLLNFATSHNNKLTALNKSFEGGGSKQRYKQFDPVSGTMRWSDSNPDSKFPHAFVNANVLDSLEHARTVDVEAQAVTKAYNELAQGFPELGGKAITPVALAAGLRQGTTQDAQKAAQAQVEVVKAKNKESKKAPKKPQEPSEESGSTTPASESLKPPAPAPAPVEPEKPQTLAPLGKYDQLVKDQKATLKDGIYYVNEAGATKYMAGTTPSSQVYVNLGKLRENKSAFLDYLTKGPSSDQKKAMLSLMGIDLQTFHDVINSSVDGKSPIRSVAAFLKDHELSHLKNEDSKSYPKKDGKPDLMSPDAIRIEARATLDALSDEQLAKMGTSREEVQKRLQAPQAPVETVEAPVAPETTPNQAEQTTTAPPASEELQLPSMAEDPVPAKPAKAEKISVKEAMVKAFPRLYRIPGKIRNFLHESFQLKQDSSRLEGSTGIAQAVWTALKSLEGMKAWFGEENVRWTPEIGGAFQGLLSGGNPTNQKNMGGIVRAMQENLDTFLQETYDVPGVGKLTHEQILREGQIELTSLANGKVLSLLVLNKQNKFEYDPNLLHAAIMAALQWQITASSRQTILKEDQIKKELGLKETDELNEKVIDALATGTSLADAKSTIASIIRRFWGVKGLDSAAMGYTEAIPEALAAEILRAMETVKLVQVTEVKLHEEQPELGIKQTLHRYKAVEWGEKSPFYSYPSLLEEMMVVEPERITFYGDDKVPVKKSQLGNSNIKNSEISQTAVKNQQDTQFRLHKPMVTLLRSLNEKALHSLMANDLGEKSNYNKNDFESREAKNLSVTNALKELKKIYSEMESEANGRKVDLYKLGKKFQFAVGSNQRMMMQGAYTPQASKLMREALLATWSTLNLSDKNGDHYKYLMLAFAQALGQKVHKNTFEVNVEWAHTAITIGHLVPALDVLKQYLAQVEEAETKAQQGTEPAPVEFPTAAFKAALPKGEKTKVESSPLVLMALLEIARMQRAETKSEKIDSFETPLYLESDGMTNGPFNTMGLLTTGQFTAEWVGHVRRGGVDFLSGDEPTTSNKLLDRAGGDIYKASMDATKPFIADLLNRLRGQKGEDGAKVLWVANRLYTAMGQIFPSDVKWAGLESKDGLTLERGIGKNPITQFVYGASASGIATYVASKLMKSLYEAMSEIATDKSNYAKHKLLLEAVASIATYSVGKSKEGNRMYVRSEEGDVKALWERMQNPREFTFKPEEIERIQSNLRHLLIEPMTRGITSVLGTEVVKSGSLIAKVTQLQATVARNIYMAEIKNRVDEKAAAFEEAALKEAGLDGEEKMELYPLAREVSRIQKEEAPYKRTLTRLSKVKNLKAEQAARQAEAQKALNSLEKEKQEKIGHLSETQQQELMQIKDIQEAADNRASSEFLSTDELNQVWEKTVGVMPIVKSDGQTFLIAKSALLTFWNDRTNREQALYQYSRSLDKEMKTVPNVDAIDNPGVAGIPYFTIGMGDARMVRDIFQTTFANAMQVFDGINIPVDHIAEYGNRINKSALKAWQGNVFMDLLNTFDQFMRQPEVATLLATAKGQLKNEQSFKIIQDLDAESLKTGHPVKIEDMNEIRADLLFAAQSMQARIVALSKFQLSMDQMAGTYQPFLQKGQKFAENATPEEIANAINAEYLKALDTIKSGIWLQPEGQEKTPAGKAPVAPAKVLTPGQKRVSSKTWDTSPVDRKSGVIVAPALSLRTNKVLKGALSKTEWGVLTSILNSQFLPGIKLVVGRIDQVAIYQQERGFGSLANILEKHPNGELNGFYNAQEKTIYILNPAAETVVHEVIHAATYQMVQAYYDGKLPPGMEADAIRRLEGLMEQFLADGNHRLDLSTEAGRAILDAQAEISKYRPLYLEEQTSFQKAAALNEFMAWTLANRRLAEELSKRKVTDKLVKLTKAAWDAIKKLIFGKRAPDGLGHGTDMLSQIRFNTAVLTQSTLTLEQQVNNIGLAHSTLTGQEGSRLERITEAFGRQIARHLNQVYSKTWLQDLSTNPSLTRAFEIANKLSDEAKDLFKLAPGERETFHMMVLALATEARIDPQSMSAASRVYDRFLQVTDQHSFLEDRYTTDQNLLTESQKQYLFLSGRSMVEDDDFKRSSMLPVFVALGTVSEDFRKYLAKHQMPEQKSGPVTGLDTLLEKVGAAGMQSLENRLSGTDRPTNLQEALDQLTLHVTDQTLKANTVLENLLEKNRSFLHGVNGKMTDLMKQAGEAAFRKSNELAKGTSKLDQGLSSMLKVVAFTSNERDSAAVAEDWLSQMDKKVGLTGWVRDFMGSDGLIGRVASQAQIYDMFKKVRASLAQMRQQYREHIPFIIHSKFSNLGKPDDKTYHMLYKTLGRSDLATLLDGRSLEKVLELAANRNLREDELRKLEMNLRDLRREQFPQYDEKINQLVDFMHGGPHGSNLLRNAYAISELLGMTAREEMGWMPPNEQVVNLIDQITTLRYLARVSDTDQAKLTSLVQNEKEAMHFILSYLKGQRIEEMKKASEDMARFNHYKGSLPYESNRGHLMVVEGDQDAKMQLLGYKNMGKYLGSSIEDKGTRYYYFSPEGGARTMFNQGLVQNVQGTAYGVHTLNGFTSGPNAGYITDPDYVAHLAQWLGKEKVASQQGGVYGRENLSPIYNPEGQVVAFERTLDPSQLALIQQDQHLGKMIGHWRGRQVEELQAREFNAEVVKHLGDMWDKDKLTGDKDRYINLLDPKNKPIIKDAVKLLPREVRTQLAERFGEGVFMVRRNLVNQVVGYRSASIGDMWTGNTDISPEVQDTVKKTLITIWGIDAYRKVMKFERNVQGVTAAMRTNIVVRSMIVPMANTMSGFYQLMARGVPLIAITRGAPRKLVEIEEYSQVMAKKIQLEAELHAATDVNTAGAIQARIQNLDDSIKRLSIWPLIEAGEFSSIADVGNTADGFGKEEGTIVEQIEHAVDKLPPALRSVARLGYISRDTALFQVLQKSVQYSDFVMKAIYYDHLLQHEEEFLEQSAGFPVGPMHPKARAEALKKAALGRITEEFNNYDLPTGRGRQYLESMGLMWFLNYKIRAAKIGLSMVRNNPLGLLMHGLTPHPMAGGIPFTDNLFARLFQGSIGHALGPGMLVQPVAWNAWYNLFGN